MFLFKKKPEKRYQEINLDLEEIIDYLELELEDANDLYERSRLTMQSLLSSKERLLQERNFKISYFQKNSLSNLLKYLKKQQCDLSMIDKLKVSDNVAISRLGLSYEDLINWYLHDYNKENASTR